MKRITSILFSLVLLGFMAGIANADALGMDCPGKNTPNPAPARDAGSLDRSNTFFQVREINLKNVPTIGAFVLSQDHIHCLEKCQNEFKQCMNNADGPTEEFRCGEKRTACTLSCDDDQYRQDMQADL